MRGIIGTIDLHRLADTVSEVHFAFHVRKIVLRICGIKSKKSILFDICFNRL